MNSSARAKSAARVNRAAGVNSSARAKSAVRVRGVLPLLFSLLNRRERVRLAVLLLVSTCAAALAVGSIALFGPFMRLVADPAALHQGVINRLYVAGGFDSPRSFLALAGAVVFLLLLMSNIVKVLTLHGIHQFAGTCRSALSVRLFSRYLHRPWAFYLERNTGNLSQELLSEVDSVVDNVLKPFMDAVSQAIVVLGILLFLFLTSPVAALMATVILTVAYTGIYLVLRSRLARLGLERWTSNGRRFTTAAEAFGVMKELKVLRLEENFIGAYATVAHRHARAETWSQTWSTVPRYLLEAFAFGLVIAMILVLLALEGTMAGVLPLLAVYALAGYRLLPALQIVYNSVAQARYYHHAVGQLYRDMQDLPATDQVPCVSGPAPAGDRPPVSGTTAATSGPPEPFRSIQLIDLSFRYDGAREETIRDVNLEITRNELVAFAGSTGCGKTTLADIILGLLQPTSGSILINGQPWTDRAGIDLARTDAASADLFGYVPQEIHITDDTIRANIALGLSDEGIDQDAVERAARIANLHRFITEELPAAYQTLVGERGIRLSGGQRQRLGIARALYRDPQILVLDEATSALDTVTEEAVLQAVTTLYHRKTIILIAHRLATVERCDRIYLLERGRITATGTHGELLEKNSAFRQLAGAGGRPDGRA